MSSYQFWFSCLCILWLYFVWSRRQLYLLILKLRGPLGYPIIGIVYKNLSGKNVLNIFASFFNKYGSVCLTWFGPIPFVLVSDPQVTQDILYSPHCINKVFVYKALVDGVGDGLLIKDDPTWSVHRKLLNPAFGQHVLLDFIPSFNKMAGSLIETLDNAIGDSDFDLRNEIHVINARIAIQTTFGNDIANIPKFDTTTLMKHIYDILETLGDMVFAPWLLYKPVRQLFGKEGCYTIAKTKVNSLINEIIEYKPTEYVQSDLLDDKNIVLNVARHLVERGMFDARNVEVETYFIAFAAFETNAGTISNTMLMLAMFPEYQKKAFDEIVALFPDRGDFQVSHRDLSQLVYLDQIVNETMRLMPAAPIIGRYASHDLKLTNGIVIPKGVNFFIDIFNMHRSKQIWGQDAGTFNPDRFLSHNVQARHPCAFIPFSKGKRNCLGWRYAQILIKVVLAKLIRNYIFTTDFPFEKLEFDMNLFLRIKTVPTLKFEQRI